MSSQPIGRHSRPANRTDGAGYPCGAGFRPTAPGQPGGAAEQQVPATSTSQQRGFDDLALRVRVAAARCRIEDELQR